MRVTGKRITHLTHVTGLSCSTFSIIVCLILMLNPGKIFCSEKSSSRLVNEYGPCKVGEMVPSFAIPHNELGVISARTLKQIGQPVLISFWASWCNPCIKSMDKVAAWKKKLESNGKAPPTMLFIGLVDDQELALQTIEKHSWSFLFANDRFGAVGKRFGLGQKASLPFSVLINPNGTIRAIFEREGDDFVSILEREWIAACILGQD
jgi:thiol-disulfide isomerase/thioredoxin